jgi:hypothetical protein
MRQKYLKSPSSVEYCLAHAALSLKAERLTQRVRRHVDGSAADDQQVLARRTVPPRRIVVHAAVAHVHAIDDGIAKRSAALDDPPAHGVGYSHAPACVLARPTTPYQGRPKGISGVF